MIRLLTEGIEYVEDYTWPEFGDEWMYSIDTDVNGDLIKVPPILEVALRTERNKT